MTTASPDSDTRPAGDPDEDTSNSPDEEEMTTTGGKVLDQGNSNSTAESESEDPTSLPRLDVSFGPDRLRSQSDGIATHEEPLQRRIRRYQETIVGRLLVEWYYRVERQRNLEEGYGPYRNDPTYFRPDNVHSPSKLLGCKRKDFYEAKNAPREDPFPLGLFAYGHWFEKQVIEPWLRDAVVSEDEHVINGLDILFDEPDEDLIIGGQTDPVIVDAHGVPLAMTEVKTTGNLYFTRRDGQPKRHHLAQAHAYMKGLREGYDDLDEFPPTFFVYGERDALTDIVSFLVEFDETFWDEEVLPWMEKSTDYRESDRLPPADPEMIPERPLVECSFCDYKERCGNYDHTDDRHKYDDTIARKFKGQFSDSLVKGFVPLKIYPEDAVVAHLRAHEDVQLTPTLARYYPELVADSNDEISRQIEQRGVYDSMVRMYGSLPQRNVHDWVCSNCDRTTPYKTIAWDGDLNNSPACPHCRVDSKKAFPLRGPTPAEIENANDVS